MAVKQPTAINGLDMIVLCKLLEDESADAKRICFQTEGELTEKAKTDSEGTKDGTIVNAKALESELSCTSYVARNSDQYQWITEAFRDKKEFELWLVDTKDIDSSGKCKGQYFQGVISEKKDKAGAENKFQMEVTFTIAGKGKFGYTAIPEFSANDTDYPFKEAVQPKAKAAVSTASTTSGVH